MAHFFALLFSFSSCLLPTTIRTYFLKPNLHYRVSVSSMPYSVPLTNLSLPLPPSPSPSFSLSPFTPPPSPQPRPLQCPPGAAPKQGVKPAKLGTSSWYRSCGRGRRRGGGARGGGEVVTVWNMLTQPQTRTRFILNAFTHGRSRMRTHACMHVRTYPACFCVCVRVRRCGHQQMPDVDPKRTRTLNTTAAW